MKKTFYLVAIMAMATLTFTSCGKEDNAGEPSQIEDPAGENLDPMKYWESIRLELIPLEKIMEAVTVENLSSMDSYMRHLGYTVGTYTTPRYTKETDYQCLEMQPKNNTPMVKYGLNPYRTGSQSANNGNGHMYVYNVNDSVAENIIDVVFADIRATITDAEIDYYEIKFGTTTRTFTEWDAAVAAFKASWNAGSNYAGYKSSIDIVSKKYENKDVHTFSITTTNNGDYPLGQSIDLSYGYKVEQVWWN